MTTPPPALCRMPSEEEIKKMALLFASLREGRWSVEEYEQEIHRLLESKRVMEAHHLIRRLYLARKAAKKAKDAWNEAVTEHGRCEGYAFETGPCHAQYEATPAGLKEYCDCCREKQPFYEDRIQKSLAAAAALRSVMAAGRAMVEKGGPDD